MPNEFQYDVFLSQSAKDKAVVCAVAERLQKDGLKVWFDEWVLKPGDSIPAKIEEGLESDQAQSGLTPSQQSPLDHQPTDAPLNKDRRSIPRLLDDAPTNGFSIVLRLER